MTLPVHKARKFSTVCGTSSPYNPMTILPTSLPSGFPIPISKYTLLVTFDCNSATWFKKKTKTKSRLGYAKPQTIQTSFIQKTNSTSKQTLTHIAHSKSNFLIPSLFLQHNEQLRISLNARYSRQNSRKFRKKSSLKSKKYHY